MKPCQTVLAELRVIAHEEGYPAARALVADVLESRPPYLRHIKLRGLLATCTPDASRVLGPYAKLRLANLPERAALALAIALRGKA